MSPSAFESHGADEGRAGAPRCGILFDAKRWSAHARAELAAMVQISREEEDISSWISTLSQVWSRAIDSRPVTASFDVRWTKQNGRPTPAKKT
jgi:hypothetical protein